MGNEVPVTSGPQTLPDGQPEPDLSLADHEAQFGGGAAAAPEAEKAPGGESSTSEAEAAPPSQTGRDDKGRFRPRQRAKSQEASPEDVPRIKELTKKLREAEAERDRLRSQPPLTGSTAPPAATGQAVTTAAVAPPEATARPKPKPSDVGPDGKAKYATYEDYLDDRDAWSREQLKTELAAEQQKQDEQRRVRDSWTSRVTKARDVHADFDQVAIYAPTKIPPGSLVDAWILDDDDGAEILYHLQTHEDELTALLAQPVRLQAKTLSLLGQRLSSPPAQGHARTGAVAREPVTVPPRPPTPVRTVAPRATEEPPGDDASLAEHERTYAPRPRLR